MPKFDVDPYALAEEISPLLKKERRRPKSIRQSFQQVSANVYRSHNIRGELWYAYNREIGTILNARPRKRAVAKQKAAVPQKPVFDLRSKKDEVVLRGVKYALHSFFMPGGTLIVELIPGAELHFRVVEGKVKGCGARNTFDKTRKVEKHLLAFGMKIAKVRFAEKDKRQGELDF
ncbi:MAG: hypothetical protein AAB869_01075 [Patescibacteria group bacterium]